MLIAPRQRPFPNCWQAIAVKLLTCCPVLEGATRFQPFAPGPGLSPEWNVVLGLDGHHPRSPWPAMLCNYGWMAATRCLRCSRNCFAFRSPETAPEFVLSRCGTCGAGLRCDGPFAIFVISIFVLQSAWPPIRRGGPYRWPCRDFVSFTPRGGTITQKPKKKVPHLMS